MKTKIIISLLFLAGLLIFSGNLCAQREVIELNFKFPDNQLTDKTRTLQSIVTVRDISEQYATGGLYLMTHFGDREELFQNENQKFIETPFIDQTSRWCSIFSTKTENEVYMGRNWDNQNVGSIIVSLYYPPNGYSSISFSRAIDLGFPLNVGLDDITETPFGEKFLLTPFNSMDGINEHGLSVAIAGIKDVPVKPVEGKKLVFISYLVQKMLSKTKSIDEVIQFVDDYVPFLLNSSSIQAHLLVTDATGRSVILEYLVNEWQVISSDRSWQTLTNKIVYDVPHEKLMDKCWRYKSISETLEKTNGNVDWKQGLDILKDVEQKGTSWSTLYMPKTKEIYFTVYQSWDKIYHIKLPDSNISQ